MGHVENRIGAQKKYQSWRVFIKERFPIGVYLFLAMGFAVSGAVLGAGNWREASIVALGVFLFLCELRLMDEYKDFHKDKIAYPNRPLPRGVLSLNQVERAIRFMYLIMLGYVGLVWSQFNSVAAALCALYTIYLWGMYREFYVGKQLTKSPMIYAISHQIVIVPICLFSVAIHSYENTVNSNTLSFSLAIMGAFFGYEICRKLDPQAHPELKTYLSVYGPWKTLAAVGVLLILGAVSALGLGAQEILWPIELFTGLSLVVIVFKPWKFKWVENIASLSLICHLWAAPLHHLLRSMK